MTGAARDEGSPEWIKANVDQVLAVLERLYCVAADTDTACAIEFLDRMSWLPKLLAELEPGKPLDG
jgi:hypothetical protein